MTPWSTVVILATAGLGGGLIGAVVGVRFARSNRDALLHGIRQALSEERWVSAVYLDVAIGWRAYLRAVHPLGFPEEGFAADTPRDLAAVLRSRAQLERFGSTSVQQLHDEALEGAVTLINVLRSLPKAPFTGDPDIAAGREPIRVLLEQIGTKVDALERQMSRELQPLTASAEPSLEVTGRVRPEPETVAGGRRQSEPDADRRVVSHVDSR